MATPRKPASARGQDYGPPPPTTPNEFAGGFGNPDHSFTLQAIMELQKSVGELKSAIDTLKSSVDGTKSRVDDLVNWKNKILGGAIAVGAVASLFAFLIVKFSDYIEFRRPPAQTVQVAPPATPQLPSVAPSSKMPEK